jgi:hypothetical protein
MGLTPVSLLVQYRMHPLISAWPNQSFYQGRLTDGVPQEKRVPPPGFPWLTAQGAGSSSSEGSAAKLPVALVPVLDFEDSQPGKSKANASEARVVLSIVSSLLTHGLSAADMGVVTPYMGQVRALRDLFARAGGSDEGRGELRRRDEQLGISLRMGPFAGLEVMSVDGFQGREKEVIIFSCVRSNSQGNVGFLADQRRLNVAITRAKRGLVVVGNPRTLACDPRWKSWLDFVQGQQLLVDPRALPAVDFATLAQQVHHRHSSSSSQPAKREHPLPTSTSSHSLSQPGNPYAAGGGGAWQTTRFPNNTNTNIFPETSSAARYGEGPWVGVATPTQLPQHSRPSQAHESAPAKAEPNAAAILAAGQPTPTPTPTTRGGGLTADPLASHRALVRSQLLGSSSSSAPTQGGSVGSTASKAGAGGVVVSDKSAPQSSVVGFVHPQRCALLGLSNANANVSAPRPLPAVSATQTQHTAPRSPRSKAEGEPAPRRREERKRETRGRTVKRRRAGKAYLANIFALGRSRSRSRSRSRRSHKSDKHRRRSRRRASTSSSSASSSSSRSRSRSRPRHRRDSSRVSKKRPHRSPRATSPRPRPAKSAKQEAESTAGEVRGRNADAAENAPMREEDMLPMEEREGEARETRREGTAQADLLCGGVGVGVTPSTDGDLDSGLTAQGGAEMGSGKTRRGSFSSLPDDPSHANPSVAAGLTCLPARGGPEQNYVNFLQEYLQRQALGRGNRAQDLYEVEYESRGGGFRARFLLLNPQDGAPRCQSWSAELSLKKAAKQVGLGVQFFVCSHRRKRSLSVCRQAPG